MRVITLIVLLLTACLTPQIFAYDDTGTIAVQGTVPPKSDAFTLAIGASTGDTLSQDQTVIYTISYTSTSNTTPLTLQAQWYKGTIDGAPSATVEILGYEVGSSTMAYGSTPAVVDLDARTITWSIASLPTGAGTQTVSFRLKTSSDYTGSKYVSVPVHARITSPVSLTDRTADLRYLYVPREEDETRTTTPTPSPTSSITTTPAPTTSTQTNPVESLHVAEISAQSARIDYVSLTPTRTSISYGTQMNLLDQIITEERATLTHSLLLPKLAANTRYYFRIYSEVGGIRTPISDIFIFDTATQKAISDDLPILMTASQSWGITFSQLASDVETTSAQMVALSNSVLDLQFSIPTGTILKSATVIVRPPNVLGIQTDESADFQSTASEATQVGNRIYVGKVRLPKTSGKYDVVLRTEDTYGNVKETVLGQVSVVAPLKITDEQGGALQYARILLSRFNENTKRFEVLPNTATSIKNPVFSDVQGIAEFAALTGRYRAIITLDGYKEKEIEFTIDPQNPTDFPPVILSASAPSPLGYVARQRLLFRDVQYTLFGRLEELARSRQLLFAMIARALLLMPISVLVCYMRCTGKKILKPDSRIVRMAIYLLERLFEKFVEVYLTFSLLAVYLFAMTHNTAPTMLYGALILLHLVLWEVGIYRNR